MALIELGKGRNLSVGHVVKLFQVGEPVRIDDASELKGHLT